MVSDLFSVFDYSLGSSGPLGCFTPWHGGLLLTVYLCCFMIYYYDLNDVESFVLYIVDSLVGGMPETSKVWSATPHLLVSLFFLLLSICVMGFLPYSFPLAAHVIISSGLSIPFWFMTFAVNFNPNWRLAWIKSVCEGNFFVVSFILIGSECTSILIRPITLAARLSLNVIVGNIVMKMASSMVLALLFPFGYSLFSFGIPVLLGIICGVLSFGLSVVELCIMCLQTGIFYSLVVSYLSEVMVKPE
uniref:ATP synthase F0 subunit 6 n=1 Tax=Tapes dorsatus TaxID=368939 RepID=UPI002037242A|nr:ATP synthase F0 subunit 6 [Tapes dorsatus]YP_010555895.1 ATP synthase F0 subunit 6 [Tapes conspersus]URH16441.1 ATP synthase F0 subunit 6 [Tapes dorsatus]UYR95127.1 ATP synthase subunit 6 [Tapes conspersus]